MPTPAPNPSRDNEAGPGEASLAAQSVATPASIAASHSPSQSLKARLRSTALSPKPTPPPVLGSIDHQSATTLMDPSGGEGNIDDVERSPASPPAASPIDRLEADLISPDEPLSLLKIVVVGDEGCGKTALCQALTGQRFDAKLHGPTISETKYRHTFTLLNLLEGDTPTAADIVDTAGSEDLDRLRPFAYDGVHMWLVCFAVDDIQSLVSVFERWVPEVKYYHPEIPLILVGCKADLRSGEPNGDPDGSSARAVSTAAGRAVARKIDAHKYIETSAKAGLHISDFFDDGVHDYGSSTGSTPLPEDDPVAHLFGVSASLRASIVRDRPPLFEEAGTLEDADDNNNPAQSDLSVLSEKIRRQSRAGSSSPLLQSALPPSSPLSQIQELGSAVTTTKRSSVTNPLAAANSTQIKRSSVLITQVVEKQQRSSLSLDRRPSPLGDAARRSPMLRPDSFDGGARPRGGVGPDGMVLRPVTPSSLSGAVVLPSSRGPGGVAGAAAARRRKRRGSDASSLSSLSSLATTETSISQMDDERSPVSAGPVENVDDEIDGGAQDEQVGDEEGGSGAAAPDDKSIRSVAGRSTTGSLRRNMAELRPQEASTPLQSVAADSSAELPPLPPAENDIAVQPRSPPPSGLANNAGSPSMQPSAEYSGKKAGGGEGALASVPSPSTNMKSPQEKSGGGCQCSIL